VFLLCFVFSDPLQAALHEALDVSRIEGKLKIEDLSVVAVERVVRDQPKTKPAIKKIRALRTGNPPRKASPERELLKVLRPYPAPRAIEALDNVLGFYLIEERES
jgi:hypothetical protein